jgi:hypothetical protein
MLRIDAIEKIGRLHMLDAEFFLLRNIRFVSLQFYPNYIKINILPTPGEAKAKAMPGRLYTHTK